MGLFSEFQHVLGTGLLRTNISVVLLHFFSLAKGTLVSPKLQCHSSIHDTYSLLAVLVDTLLCRRSTRLDHIQDSLLIWHQASDFADEVANKLLLFTRALK